VSVSITPDPQVNRAVPPAPSALWRACLPGLLALSLILFTVACFRLGHLTQWPGNPDSVANQDAARNLVEGRGFYANTIHFYWDRQAFPNPETVRPPAVPYCLAALELVFGESSTLPVVLTGAAILLAALCIRGGVLRITGHPERRRRRGAGVPVLVHLRSDVVDEQRLPHPGHRAAVVSR
jgi:hypothetical protein